ncbi:MAG: UDP-glucose 4-epimerase GalE [Sporomusaceae bacterium]|nr:UDP-glucose 4-epimerase GalE [Sporomusaceae bacterium]
MAILVTGGAGYIGSHTCVEILNAGYEVVVVDNFSNSKPAVLDRINEITGKHFGFYEADLAVAGALAPVFAENRIEAVVHFAGLKAVGESVAKPLAYYHNNVTGTVNLCQTMQVYGVNKLVFSSSATVYGDPERVPLSEECRVGGVTNPYGRTKLMIEEILGDLCVADSSWTVTLLRYFNPIGAHESGRIGEDPNGIPNNLMPFITQVAVGRLDALQVFGSDYPTPDGTGVRDYIHVVDLAQGHLKALEHMQTPGRYVFNLGTGKGYSVLDVVKAFETATGSQIPYRLAARRSGDVPACYADPAKAAKELDWTAQKDLTDMCRDSWRWQLNNPNGYSD